MEKLGQKTWSFSKFLCLNGFIRKTYNIGQPIFFMNKLKFFQLFIAWLFCLDEIEKLASQFFLFFFWDLVNFTVSYQQIR